VAGNGDRSWLDDPPNSSPLPATVPLAPLAPPADYGAADVPEFPYLPEPTRSTSQPQSVNAPHRGPRRKLNELIDGIREGRPSRATQKSIPWGEPVADAGSDVLTLAPVTVGFESYQPVTLAAPQFDATEQRADRQPETQPAPRAVAQPEPLPEVVDVAAIMPPSDGRTVYEREFKPIR